MHDPAPPTWSVLPALLVGLAYLVVGELSELLATQAADISAFWPPAGVGLACVIRYGGRALVPIGAAAFAGNLIDVSASGLALAALESGWGPTALVDAGLAVGSAFLAWLPLRALGATPDPFGRILHAAALVGWSAVGASTIIALIGSLLYLVTGEVQPERYWIVVLTWATGDAVGIVVMAPLLLSIWPSAAEAPTVRGARWWLEFAGVLASIGLVAIPVAYDLPLEYLVLLPLIWASFRLGLRATSIAVTAVALAALLIDVSEIGYFARFRPEVSVLLVQTFVGTIALVPLTLLPTLVERRQSAMHEAKLVQDLQLARSIQRGLLPTEPPACPGFEVAGWSRPAEETGGDYFDWVTIDDHTTITLGDVTGHGVGPALVATACRASVRAAVSDATDPGALLTRLNALLVDDLPENRFITLAAIGIDHRAGVVRLRSAGQGPMLHLHAARSQVTTHGADDLPLGIIAGHDFGTSTAIDLAPGDLFLLITDGFIEWADPAGEQYGVERLCRELQRVAALPAAGDHRTSCRGGAEARERHRAG